MLALHLGKRTRQRSPADAERSSTACRGPAGDGAPARADAGVQRSIARRATACARDFLFLGRGLVVPGRPRGRAQAQGDLVRARRGLRVRRDEARPDRAGRRERAGGGPGARGPGLREGPVQPRGRSARAAARSSRSPPTATRTSRDQRRRRRCWPATSTRCCSRSSPRCRCSCSPTTFADLRGTDVDQPRNLAKSVTVE
jgi:hypothetical protein